MATTTTTATPVTSTTPAADAAKIASLRERAKDKSLPQDVRNAFLDKAVELENKAAGYAKGGMVASKKMMGGGMVGKMAYAKGGMATKAPAKKAMAKSPSVAIVIGVPKKAMAKGGAVGKKGC